MKNQGSFSRVGEKRKWGFLAAFRCQKSPNLLFLPLLASACARVSGSAQQRERYGKTERQQWIQVGLL